MTSWDRHAELGYAAAFNSLPHFGETQDAMGYVAIVPTCEHPREHGLHKHFLLYLRFRDSQAGCLYHLNRLCSHAIQMWALKTMGVMQLFFHSITGLRATTTATAVQPKSPHLGPWYGRVVASLDSIPALRTL